MANINRVSGVGSSGAGDGSNNVKRTAPNKLRGRVIRVLAYQRLLQHPVMVAPKDAYRTSKGKSFHAKKMPSKTSLHHRY